ncbi:cyclophilin-like fold protein [Microbulbifer hainanensis]|uniref:cyclophilin-like fold protein n=1 Tax=Microbulbifer hainanensis TaxID=2735675 RepID=UPI001866955C|nr:cyclophilin-like fold protein [Microbulbifer hainanensis]
MLAIAGPALCNLSGNASTPPFSKINSARKIATLTKIQITIDGKTVTASLEDSATSRDFIALLPLTLDLEDFHGIEKISDLPGRLSTEDAPSGYSPSAGDITYYAPWGNLAIFYSDFEHARGLVRLGQIDSGMDLFKRADRLKATIERTGQQD